MWIIVQYHLCENGISYCKYVSDSWKISTYLYLPTYTCNYTEFSHTFQFTNYIYMHPILRLRESLQKQYQFWFVNYSGISNFYQYTVYHMPTGNWKIMGLSISYLFQMPLEKHHFRMPVRVSSGTIIYIQGYNYYDATKLQTNTTFLITTFTTTSAV